MIISDMAAVGLVAGQMNRVDTVGKQSAPLGDARAYGKKAQ